MKVPAMHLLIIHLLGIFLMTAGIILFVSCSSAPPPKEEIFDKRNLAAQHLEFGNKYFRDTQYDQALQFFRIAREYYASVDDREGLAAAHGSIGKVYFRRGELDEAEQSYALAAESAKNTGSAELILQTANNLGEVRMKKGENDKALSIFTEALEDPKLSEARNRYRAILYHNRGTVLKSIGRFDEAKGDAEKALALNLAEKRYEELASNYYLVSSLYSKQANYSEALRFMELALEYDKKMENSLGIAQDLTAMGIILEKMEQNQEAISLYSRAFLVYKALLSFPGMERTLKALEDASVKLNNQEDAKKYREARKRIESSNE